LDVNPRHLEHVVRGYTGGIGKFAIDTYVTMEGVIKAGINMAAGKESEGLLPEWINRVPVFSRFFNEPHAGAYAKRRFWEMKRNLDNWAQAEKANQEKDEKAIVGEKTDTLYDLYDRLNGYYIDDILKYKILIDENKQYIKESKEDLKKSLTVSKQLEIETKIKKWEKEIESYKKKQVHGYRKAVDELDAKFDEIGVDYTGN
jgi:hypothetical protein